MWSIYPLSLSSSNSLWKHYSVICISLGVISALYPLLFFSRCSFLLSPFSLSHFLFIIYLLIFRSNKRCIAVRWRVGRSPESYSSRVNSLDSGTSPLAWEHGNSSLIRSCLIWFVDASKNISFHLILSLWFFLLYHTTFNIYSILPAL